MWRDAEHLPQELVFNINYLGADQSSFTLNFSKGASQVIGQYVSFRRQFSLFGEQKFSICSPCPKGMVRLEVLKRAIAILWPDPPYIRMKLLPRCFNS